MSQSQESKADAAEQRSEETSSFVRTVKAATRRRYTPEEKIRVVLEGFRQEVTVNGLCRREGIKSHSYYALYLSPNPPKDTDGRREDSGRGWVRELQGRWPGLLG